MSIRSLFRRHGGPDGETWEPGDLAECVVQTPWYRNGKPSTHAGPALGERYVVQDTCKSPRGRTYLRFARFAPRAYAANAFRKVRPQADESGAADASWTAALLWQPSQPVHGDAS